MRAVAQEVSDVLTAIKAAADMGVSLSAVRARWVGFLLREKMWLSPASRFCLKEPSDSKAVVVLRALQLKSSWFVLGTELGINGKGELRKAVSATIWPGLLCCVGGNATVLNDWWLWISDAFLKDEAKTMQRRKECFTFPGFPRLRYPRQGRSSCWLPAGVWALETEEMALPTLCPEFLWPVPSNVCTCRCFLCKHVIPKPGWVFGSAVSLLRSLAPSLYLR